LLGKDEAGSGQPIVGDPGAVDAGGDSAGQVDGRHGCAGEVAGVQDQQAGGVAVEVAEDSPPNGSRYALTTRDSADGDMLHCAPIGPSATFTIDVLSTTKNCTNASSPRAWPSRGRAMSTAAPDSLISTSSSLESG
jgi:hypothetical protein